jgi:hypothetical protein
MESIRHSAGTLRKASSKLPISTVGHSVSPAFLVQQRLVLDQCELVLLGQRARRLADQRARSRDRASPCGFAAP